MPVTSADVKAAAARISGHVRETPVLHVRGDELGLELDVWFKLEYLQVSGSFKGRGATNFVRSATFGDAGVVTASGGNHGAAVAYAAREAGVAANIFVPTISAPIKVNKLKSYGATVHQTGSVFSEALSAAEVFLANNGGLMAHPYDDEMVVAGAGTVALEFEAQAGPLDQVMVAVGGGGLASGMAAWFGERTTIVCCETDGTAAYNQATKAGHPVPVKITGVASDALGATTIGSIPWQLLQAARAPSVLVTDDDTMDAKDALWEKFNIVAEPSACVPLAALLSGKWQPTGRVGVVICGANT